MTLLNNPRLRFPVLVDLLAFLQTAFSELPPVNANFEQAIELQARHGTVYKIALDTQNGLPGPVELELVMVPPTIRLPRDIYQPVGHAWFLVKRAAGTTVTVDFSVNLLDWFRISTNYLESDVTRLL